MKGSKAPEGAPFSMGIFLAAAGGFLDAHTYLVRGGVFANAETGNIVLLGLRLAAGDGLGAVRTLFPILSFAFGVLLTEALHARIAPAAALHWRQAALLVEIFLLCGMAFVPAGRLDPLVCSLVSLVCGIQVQSFRRVGGLAAATTMCTGNLRSGTEALYQGLVQGDAGKRRTALAYGFLIACFMAGAALGQAAASFLGAHSLLLAAALLAVPLAMLPR